ncbi:MAG: DNA primase [Elusimicrobia bacterium]|nr:DNA primase [Elusimicrobiota bacterium]
MLISEETIARVRDANEIVEVISEYVPGLKRSGKDYKSVCPFHQEKTPSFLVSPSKEIFHCFGCGVGGDVFKFVMEFEHCSYPESIRKLAERKGIPVEADRSPTFSRDQDKKKKLLLILQRAMQFYHKLLMDSPEGKQALHYLRQERGLTPETIEKFQLGWAPAGGQALFKMAVKSGCAESDLVDAGLTHHHEGSDRWVDWFRNRILFPILDMKGQVIGFGGRILKSDQDAGGGYVPPKYMNSVESEVFQKGKNLYGFYQGSKAIRDENRAIVLEGYMDVIGCHQAGIECAVAPLGTSLTLDQCQILKRYVNQVTLLFDSDKAGDSAALRGAELLLEFGFLPMVARLPEGKDADDFLLQNSKEEFQNLISQSVTYFEFKLNAVWSKSGSSPDLVRKVLAVQSVLPDLLKLENEVARSEVVKLLSRRMGIDLQTIYRELEKLQKGSSHLKKRTAVPPSAKAGIPPKELLSMEEEILCLAVQHPEFREKTFSLYRGTPQIFDDSIREPLDLLSQHPEWKQAGEILGHLSEPASQRLRQLLLKQVDSAEPEKIFQALLLRLERKSKEQERKTLEEQLVPILNCGGSLSGETSEKYQKLTQALKGKQELKKVSP